MKTIPGYKVRDLVYEGSKTLVYRGQRESDSKPVVLKLLKKEFPSLKELALFRHQYAIVQPHNLPGIVKPCSLENYQNGYILVMEDCGEISLQQWRESQIQTGENDRLSLSDFLSIALQIAQILDRLHHNWIVHKDIKPANILIHPHTKQVKLIDFSISSVLPKETQALKHANVLEGTLAYLSPEQTGRMNRGIDYRTDFYSLGITFYELLTGTLPFQCNDPMELLHCHIAKQPIALEEFNIPKVISDIVAKLMAKNAEDRYQSAVGLKYDLEQCLSQWKETGEIEVFELATKDYADRFLIPEKLYGRETEVSQLLEAFDRVASPLENRVIQGEADNTGNSELLLVTGFSGIGKTATINEIYKPILAARGYFIKGKFDQFQRDIPFSALVHALKDLVEQLLTESPAQVEQWKAKILEAVGESGQVVIDLIPELEWLIGKQPAVPELDGTAAKNRFNWIFGKFIQIFPTAEHPLVMFLDDLQWADSASLQFIQMLMENSDIRHLLLLGAYRDNEVSPAHPLMLTIEEIHKTQTTVNTITLTSLKQNDLNHLIADTLGCSLEAALPLTRLVKSKTQGNPFFSHQFLHALYEENLIYFNREKGYWQCDLTQVQELALSNDVVEFMATQLRKLPEATQEVLQFAACIGNQFDLETLTLVCEKSKKEIEDFLWKALQAEFILLTRNVYQFDRNERNGLLVSNTPEELSQFLNYKFLHDRVQQAAYSTITDDRKASIHLKIGQLLWQNTSIHQRNENIFEVVNHLNLAINLIEDSNEKKELAQLNLTAGQKASASIAYDSALNYLNTGIQLLPKNSWETDYDLTLSLYENAAEAAYLIGEFDRMDRTIEVVLQNGNSLLDRLKVTEIQILFYGANNQAIKAVKIVNEFLKLLGVNFSENPSHSDIQVISDKIQAYLENTSIDRLIDLPTMTDVRLLAAMRILSSSVVSSFQVSFDLFYFNILKQIHLSIEGGNSSFSAFSYVVYGLTLSSHVNNIKSGYKFGLLANNLLDKINSEQIKAKVLQTFNIHIKPWNSHFKECCKNLLIAFSSAVEVGDLEFAAYSINGYCYFSYFLGSDLVQLSQKIQIYSDKISEIQQQKVFIWNDVYRLAVLRLVGAEAESNLSISTEYDTLLTLCLKSGDPLAMFHFYSCDLQFSYLFSHLDRAIESADRIQEYIRAGVGNIVLSQFYFYDALARLAAYPEREEEEQQQIIEKVKTYQETMQKWAHHAPMNFLNKYYLVEAEQHRVLGNKLEAIELYDRAITLAKENELVHEEALAYELAAKFYLELDKTSITHTYATLAQTYMEKAYYAYDRWGAVAKRQDLEQRYPQLLTFLNSWESWGLDSFDAHQTSSIVSYPKLSSTTTSFSSSSGITEVLDLATVIKASQALSGELELEQSIETLMRITIENVGAQTGALILSRDGNLAIEARASQDRNDDRGLQITSLQAIPIHSTSDIPLGLIHYVWRTSKTIVLDNAVDSETFATDPYIFEYQPKSVLCTPICNQGKTIGLLYLENNLTRGAFTRDRLDFLKFLTTQAAISLENSTLYQNLTTAHQKLEDYNQTLEEKVVERTQKLNHKNKCLEQTLKELQRTQSQLIQSEKMSGLGQLVSGVAHEINNPVSFISGNLFHSHQYVSDLLNLIEVYQQEYPHPTPTIQKTTEDIDLEFLIQDLPKLMNSMKTGCDRIKKIVLGLRNFSRLDESATKAVDVHEGIDNSLMLLQHRLNKKGDFPAIQVVKEYGKLPEVNCYASQINQVFINILNNAIDALEEPRVCYDSSGMEDTEQQNSLQIKIQTEVFAEKQVCIRIADNGIGMTEESRNKVFDPFFTTKPIGKGTGLGMSISYQIIVEKHGGSIECYSIVGKGTEFVIKMPIETSI